MEELEQIRLRYMQCSLRQGRNREALLTFAFDRRFGFFVLVGRILYPSVFFLFLSVSPQARVDRLLREKSGREARAIRRKEKGSCVPRASSRARV